MSLGVAEKLKVSPKIKSITVNDERHIALKWSKVPLAEKYAVKRATDAGGEFEHLTWVKKCEFIDETAEENQRNNREIHHHRNCGYIRRPQG